MIRQTHASVDDRNIVTSEEEGHGLIESIAIFLSYLVLVLTFPVSIFLCIMVVAEYERAVVFRLGRLRKGGARGPGVVFVLPCVDDYYKVDLRTASFDIPPQEILTKDSVTIKVDAVVYFRLEDPLKAIIQVENYQMSTQLLSQTTLRNVAGTKMLVELLTEKDQLSQAIQKIIDAATAPWGVKVERVEIKDVRLPYELQRAMAAEAEAVREAKAKIVAAEGEKSASQSLKEASDVIAKNPIALQLRYLQTLSSISAERNSTVIFPFPLDLLGGFNIQAKHRQSSEAGGSSKGDGYAQIEPTPAPSPSIVQIEPTPAPPPSIVQIEPTPPFPPSHAQIEPTPPSPQRHVEIEPTPPSPTSHVQIEPTPLSPPSNVQVEPTATSPPRHAQAEPTPTSPPRHARIEPRTPSTPRSNQAEFEEFYRN